VTDEAEDHKTASKRGKQTRERILEVAEQLIAEHGVEAFELKEVAARVGIRSPSIFAHFKGREDLAEAVARRVGIQVVDHFRPEGETPRQMVNAAVRSMVLHLASNPAHARILLADLARHREGGGPSGSAVQLGEAHHQVGRLIAHGQTLGVFRELRTDLFTAQMIGAILAALAWYGFPAEGGVPGPIEVEDIICESSRMGWHLLAASPDADE